MYVCLYVSGSGQIIIHHQAQANNGMTLPEPTFLSTFNILLVCLISQK